MPEERIRYITHKGHQILLVDCTNCDVVEMLQICEIVPKYVTAQPRGTVLLLADFTGAHVNREVMDTMKTGAVYDRPHLKRSAWVGTEAIPKVFYENLKSFSKRDLPTFHSREEALEWLVKDE